MVINVFPNLYLSYKLSCHFCSYNKGQECPVLLGQKFFPPQPQINTPEPANQGLQDHQADVFMKVGANLHRKVFLHVQDLTLDTPNVNGVLLI